MQTGSSFYYVFAAMLVIGCNLKENGENIYGRDKVFTTFPRRNHLQFVLAGPQKCAEHQYYRQSYWLYAPSRNSNKMRAFFFFQIKYQILYYGISRRRK